MSVLFHTCEPRYLQQESYVCFCLFKLTIYSAHLSYDPISVCLFVNIQLLKSVLIKICYEMHFTWLFGIVATVYDVGQINEVVLRLARLVLGWHVISHSCVMISITNCYIRFTFFHFYRAKQLC